jgi:hypothetical protein
MATFSHFRSHLSSQNRVALWGPGRSSGTDIGSRLYLPKQTTLGDATLQGPNAPGGGNTYTIQAKVSGSLTGPVATVVDPNQGVRTALGVICPAINVIDLTVNSLAQAGISGAPPVETIYAGFAYVVDSPDNDTCWINSQDGASNIGLAATNLYISFEWAGTSATGQASEANTQVPWPSPGTLKYCAVVYDQNNASPVELALRINSLDTALVLSLPATGGTGAKLVKDLTTSVDVSPGDLLAWRYRRTSGADINFSVGIVLGFQHQGF